MAFITFGHHGLIAGMKKLTVWSFLLTIVLAVVFTALQAFEYSSANFSIADGIFGTTFYASTGLHGFHVIVGTIFIIIAFIRIINNNITRQTHVGIESGIWYWHFVDIVWLFLFIFIYCWGR